MTLLPLGHPQLVPTNLKKKDGCKDKGEQRLSLTCENPGSSIWSGVCVLRFVWLYALSVSLSLTYSHSLLSSLSLTLPLSLSLSSLSVSLSLSSRLFKKNSFYVLPMHPVWDHPA